MNMAIADRAGREPGPEPFRLLESFEGIAVDQAVALDRSFPAVLWRSAEPVPADENAEIIIVRGGLVVAMAPTIRGREVAVALLEPGDAYPARTTRSGCRLEPLDYAWISSVSSPHLDILLHRAPLVGVGIIRALSGQLEEAGRAAGVLSEMRVEDRLMGLFQRLSLRHGIVTTAGIRLTLRLPHSGWGTLVGASREAVTAALIRLRRRGALECRGREVILPHSALCEEPLAILATDAA